MERKEIRANNSDRREDRQADEWLAQGTRQVHALALCPFIIRTNLDQSWIEGRTHKTFSYLSPPWHVSEAFTCPSFPVALPVKKNVPADPTQISFLGPQAIMSQAQKLADLIEQFRLAALRSRGKG